FLWIARKVTPEQSASVRSFGLEGIEFRQELKRLYPQGSLAAHVLGGVGYVGEEDVEQGNAGIERAFDDDLAGRPGEARVATDARPNPYDPIIVRAPEPGTDLTLTVDPNLQFEAERQLEKAVAANRAHSGSLIAMNPYTGDILAMANYPRFNP